MASPAELATDIRRLSTTVTGPRAGQLRRIADEVEALVPAPDASAKTASPPPAAPAPAPAAPSSSGAP